MGSSGRDNDQLKATVTEAVSSAFEQFSNIFLHKIDNLVSKVQHLEQRQDQIEFQVKNMGESVQQEFKSVRDQMNEMSQRTIRMSNIVMMGVEENSAGLALAKRIMTLILPSWDGIITDRRIGQPNPSKPRPRPLRIALSNSLLRTEALNNCNKLKGMDEFKSISVQKDLTRKEQAEWQVRRTSQRNATKNGKKRGLEGHDHSQSQGSSKVSRIDLDNDESDTQ